MKTLVSFAAGFGLLGVVALLFVPLAISVYGLYLAFSASIVLGVLALFIEPSPFILGLLACFGHPEVAHKVAAWIGL